MKHITAPNTPQNRPSALIIIVVAFVPAFALPPPDELFSFTSAVGFAPVAASVFVAEVAAAVGTSKPVGMAPPISYPVGMASVLSKPEGSMVTPAFAHWLTMLCLASVRLLIIAR